MKKGLWCGKLNMSKYKRRLRNKHIRQRRLCIKQCNQKEPSYRPQEPPKLMSEIQIDDQNSVIMEYTSGPGTGEKTSQVVGVIKDNQRL